MGGTTHEASKVGARTGLSGRFCTQSELAMPKVSLEDQPSGLMEAGSHAMQLRRESYLGFA